MERWLDAWEGRIIRVEGTEYIETGDYVVVREEHQGRGKHSAADVSMVVWSVSLVRDGRIVRRDEFFDRGEALEAAGLSE